MSFSTLSCSAHTTRHNVRRPSTCCRARMCVSTFAIWTCCCVAFRNGMTRERAVACTVTVLEPPLRVAFDYSSPQTYWHMCRNGENGRRDARQWEFSIYARLTRQGGVRVRRCATGFPANCAGGLECAAGQSAQHRNRTHICSSDGRRSNRMALQSHPPSSCKHFNQFINLGATWRQWLSDSAVVLGLMTARRSRPQRKNLGLLC
jgi:hypothetical protein